MVSAGETEFECGENLVKIYSNSHLIEVDCEWLCHDKEQQKFNVKMKCSMSFHAEVASK